MDKDSHKGFRVSGGGAYVAVGSCQLGSKARKGDIYALVREFTGRFKVVHGSILYRDLLGCDLNMPEGLAFAGEEAVFHGLPAIRRDCCPMLEKML